MKKFLLIAIVFLALSPQAFAGECHKITDVEDYWVRVKSGVNIRDEVCDGNVIGSLSTDTVVKVTGEIEGWRYVEYADGNMGFIWSDFVEPTSAPTIILPIASLPVVPLHDVTGHTYEEDIRYLGDKDIVQGYPDGSYQPERSVNRAEFTKIIVGAKLGAEPENVPADCFPDVKPSDWFASYVCYAKSVGIIGGYPDGTFKPSNNINLAEATKILVNTMAVDMSSDDSGDWFEVFIRSMQNLSYIPSNFNEVSDLVNRSQMAEMVWRIMEGITNKPAKSFTFTDNSTSSVLSCADTNLPSSVNVAQARNTWFGWVNAARKAAGKNNYNQSATLNATAQNWSDYSAGVGVMSHTRPGQTDYYDYALITQWFEDLGVTFNNAGGWTYSENIGRTHFNCSKSDCTQEFIDGTKQIFDAYMAEKGTSYTAHYDSVMGGFNQMGIAWTLKGKDLYITVHYAADINQEPSLTCS